MYGSRTLGVNCRVAVSINLSSFNLDSPDGMERCSAPLGCAWICACVGSKEIWCVYNTKKEQNITCRYFTNSLI